MEEDFEKLVITFLDTKIGIANGFLKTELAEKLKVNLRFLFEKQCLSKAGIGNKETVLQNSTIRTDKIFWLDRKHNQACENEFMDLIESFIKYLNLTCFTGINAYEFHYSLYENGDFYTKHLDQFQNNSSRKYSMIFYLNENWLNEDGGQLLIHHINQKQYIDPIQGRAVFFNSSEVLHEVLLTNKSRMSITGWLKCDVS